MGPKSNPLKRRRKAKNKKKTLEIGGLSSIFIDCFANGPSGGTTQVTGDEKNEEMISRDCRSGPIEIDKERHRALKTGSFFCFVLFFFFFVTFISRPTTPWFTWSEATEKKKKLTKRWCRLKKEKPGKTR